MKVILTVTKYNVNIKWENLSTITYGTKLNNTHLNAKAFGLHGEVNGIFHYFDQYKNKINIGDILNIGHHKISAIFYPVDFGNYNGNVVTRNFVVTRNVKTSSVSTKTSTHTSIKSRNSNVININVNTNY